jgi:ribosomal protein L14E/L6E/L27E
MINKIQVGSLVYAKSGRDRGKYFVVMSIVNEKFIDYAYLADGKSRSLENPKKKNFKHLFCTNKIIPIKGLTNKSLRCIIREFCIENSV